MEFDFDEDGGHSYLATGRDATTTLRVARDGENIPLELEARWRHSLMSLGVSMGADEARCVGRHLMALADELEDGEE